MRVIAVIPARYGSTRLEGKPLADIKGRPMIQWVYEAVIKATKVEHVLIATDDGRIARCAEGFGAPATMTDSACRTGTERVAQAVKGLDADVVINVQADEPFVEPALIDRLAQAMEDRRVQIATPMTPLRDEQAIEDPNVVKVVTDREGFALYFSRSPIPYRRSGGVSVYKHIGIYAYRKDVLFGLVSLNATPLELAEGLEQLRALENGYRIRLIETEHDTIAVDTPQDLERARRFAERLA